MNLERRSTPSVADALRRILDLEADERQAQLMGLPATADFCRRMLDAERRKLAALRETTHGDD